MIDTAPTARQSRALPRSRSGSTKVAPMAHLKIPGYRARARASGTYYFWEPSPAQRAAGWQTIPFGRDQDAAIAGSRARNVEVAEWKTGRAMPDAIRAAVRRATISHAIARYRAEHLPHLRTDRARLTANSHLRAIEDLFGELLVDELKPHHVHDWRDRMLGRGKYTGQTALYAPHTTHNRLRALRGLYNWMKKASIGLATSNPADDFDMPQPKGRKQVWERDDEGVFIAAALDLGLPSMALAMRFALYTAQRQQDVIGFTEHSLTEIDMLASPQLDAQFRGKDGRIFGWDLTQRKTETTGLLPFDPHMRTTIETTLRTNRARDRANGRLLTHLIVDDRTGLPFTEHGFIRTWQAVLDHAIAATGRKAMATLQWRDLRRTRVVRLKRMGLEREAIGSLTLHAAKSIDKMLEVYGPTDATTTANTIATALAHEAQADAARERMKG